MKSFDIIGVESNNHDVTITMGSGEKILIVPLNSEIVVKLLDSQEQKLEVKATGDIEVQISVLPNQ